MTARPKPRARRRARRALVQAVYQWQMTGADARDVERQFLEGGALENADVDFFRDLLDGVVGDSTGIDALFSPYLDRRIDSVDYVELALLRLGAYELKHRIDVPYRVVIDEYVELAKLFGAEDSYKYINGVLDQVARTERPIERLGS